MRGAKAKREDGVTRKITHPVRFAKDEYEELRWKSHQAGISISEFIRRAAINKQIRFPQPPPQVNREIYRELSAIGVNLNQLVKAMNTANKAGTLLSVDADAIAFPMKELTRLNKQTQLQLLGCGDDSQDTEE